MSPTQHAPDKAPRSSRSAVFVYAVSGAIGILGIFAAVQPGQPLGDLALPPAQPPVVEVTVIIEDVDARTLVGVWRNGNDVIVLDALGFGSACVSGLPRSFGWSVRGNQVFSADGSLLGALTDDATLAVGGQAFHAVQDSRGAK